MLKVEDKASIATIHWLADIAGIRAGASTGTNLWGALQVAAGMQSRGEQGSIVTLMCDSGERYLDTYHNLQWVEKMFVDISVYTEQLQKFA